VAEHQPAGISVRGLPKQEMISIFVGTFVRQEDFKLIYSRILS